MIAMRFLLVDDKTFRVKMSHCPHHEGRIVAFANEQKDIASILWGLLKDENWLSAVAL